jgi:hypothetical protein
MIFHLNYIVEAGKIVLIWDADVPVFTYCVIFCVNYARNSGKEDERTRHFALLAYCEHSTDMLTNDRCVAENY